MTDVASVFALSTLVAGVVSSNSATSAKSPIILPGDGDAVLLFFFVLGDGVCLSLGGGRFCDPADFVPASCCLCDPSFF